MHRIGPAFLLLLTVGVRIAGAQTAYVPARSTGGPLPDLPPPNTVGWIDDLVELELDAAGEVREIVPIRHTPLPADTIASALKRWHFQPATIDRRGVPSRVLVAALFRPPVPFNNPTPGNPPAQTATPSTEIPFPSVQQRPQYPPLGVSDAVVLVEVLVGSTGDAQNVRVVIGAGAFDQATLDAVRRWKFRPAVRDGKPVESYAYVIAGFRRPLAF